jgi:hypothetical protein
MIKNLLARTQEELYEEYVWPFFKIKPYIVLNAGQRYYDAPANMNFDRIQEVAVWYNEQPQPVERGIGFAEYAQYDSDSDVRADPVLKWDLVDVDGALQLEVWPIPASNGSKLQLLGVRKLNPLIADTDRADLDDRLIVLNAAAEHLSGQDAKDAKLKLAKAQARFSRLKGNSQGGGNVIRLPGAEPATPPRGHVTILVR